MIISNRVPCTGCQERRRLIREARARGASVIEIAGLLLSHARDKSDSRSLTLAKFAELESKQATLKRKK